MANVSSPITSPQTAPALDEAMVRAIVEETLRTAGHTKPAPAGEDSPIIGFQTLLQRLGDAYGERGLRDLITDGTIPSIRPKGVRKLAFFWPGVVEALRRHEKGGVAR